MILLIIICLLLSACSNNETGNGSSALALNSTYDSSNLVGSESIDGETDIENDYKLVTVEERDNNKVISEVTGEDKLKEILPLFESNI